MCAEEFSHFEVVGRSCAACQNDNSDLGRFMPQCHRDFQTVTIRHEQVCDYECGGIFSELPEAVTPIGRIHDEVAGSFQHPPEEGTDLVVVVNEEDGTRLHDEVFPFVAWSTA